MAVAEFIRLTAEEASLAVIDELEMSHCRRYLELICNCHGKDKGASGCLLIVVTGDGKVKYLPAGDLRDFLVSPRQMIERVLALEQTAVRELEFERKQQVEQARASERSRRLPERQIERDAPSQSL